MKRSMITCSAVFLTVVIFSPHLWAQVPDVEPLFDEIAQINTQRDTIVLKIREALENVDSQTAINVWKRLFEESDWRLRSWAVYMITEIGKKDPNILITAMNEIFFRLLDEPHPRARLSAAAHLSSLLQNADREIIVGIQLTFNTLLTHGYHLEPNTAVLMAIEGIYSRWADPTVGARVVDSLVDVLNRPCPKGQKNVMQTLGALGTKSTPALPKLMEMANDPTQPHDIRDAAKMAIAQIQKEAKP